MLCNYGILTMVTKFLIGTVFLFLGYCLGHWEALRCSCEKVSVPLAEKEVE